MIYPKAEIRFSPEMDCPINSSVLRSIFKIMKVDYDKESDAFTNGMDWSVKIEDAHDNEEVAHYELVVGEGDISKCVHATYRVRYCDYLSESDDKDKEIGQIKNNPGEWKITVWLPEGTGQGVLKLIAEAINTAYETAMIDALPEYEILTSALMP